MTERRPSRFAEALRRSWWIPVVALVAGAAVGAFVSLSGPTEYEARAALVVDPATVSTQPRVPRPDAVVAMAQAEGFVATRAIEAATGGEAIVELRSFTTGAPQDRVWVAVTMADEAAALATAKAGAEALLVQVDEMMKPVVDNQRKLVAANELALERLRKRPESDVTDFFLWDVEKDNLNERATLEYLETAYSYDGDAIVTPTQRTLSAGMAAVGGALAGLVLGLAIAWLRERGLGDRTAGD